MATYPDDAAAPTTTAFSTVSEQTFTNTGTTRTDFNLANPATNKAEVVPFIEGVEQSISTFDLSNSSHTVSFTTAPNASNLTIKIITIPTRFLLNRTFPTVRAIDYSNGATQVVNGNNYTINSETVMLISTNEFDIAASNSITGFDRVKKGITLVNTQL